MNIKIYNNKLIKYNIIKDNIIIVNKELII